MGEKWAAALDGLMAGTKAAQRDLQTVVKWAVSMDGEMDEMKVVQMAEWLVGSLAAQSVVCWAEP